MSWWTRACRLPGVAAASAAGGFTAGLLRGDTAPVPSIAAGGAVPVPVVAALALIPAVGVIWGWSGPGWEATAGSSRPMTVLLAPVVAAGLAPYLVLAAVSGGMPALLENGRDAFGVLGLALVGTWALGLRGAVLVPVAHLLITFLFGTAPGSLRPHPWAWVLLDAGDARSLAISAVLGMTGLVLARRVPARFALGGGD